MAKQRELTNDEIADWLAGRTSYDGATETEHGVIVED